MKAFKDETARKAAAKAAPAETKTIPTDVITKPEPAKVEKVNGDLSMNEYMLKGIQDALARGCIVDSPAKNPLLIKSNAAALAFNGVA